MQSILRRSRAGCGTCQRRKVKCDEAQPRCGQCTRADRSCDWRRRDWPFQDATSKILRSYTNIDRAGNPVWDRQHWTVQHSRPSHNGRDDDEDLVFSYLTTDDERERRAGTRSPGTFIVVLTPLAFARPEIAGYTPSRDMPLEWPAIGAPSHRHGRRSSDMAPNVVILRRFIDNSSESPPSLPLSTDQHSTDTELSSSLTVVGPPRRCHSTATRTPSSSASDAMLIEHFREYIVPWLIQPRFPGALPQSLSGIFEREALNFRPLHHSICALSALSLARGLMPCQTATQHYCDALGVEMTTADRRGHSSDAIVFRYFFLFIYGISMVTENDDDANKWVKHLNDLRRLAMTRRHVSAPPESLRGYVVWKICELDMYACLMGKGRCEFLGALCSYDMLPPLESQVPFAAMPSSVAPSCSPFLPGEVPCLPNMLKFYRMVVLQAAQIALVAQSFRQEASDSASSTPQLSAQWQAQITQFQSRLYTLWEEQYPLQYVGSDISAPVVDDLPERAQFVFLSAVLLFHAAIIYNRTSMYPGQGCVPATSEDEHVLAVADTEARAAAILSLASMAIGTIPSTDSNNIPTLNVTAHHVVFPVFIAGVATASESKKRVVIDLISRLENSGIGQNTSRTHKLLWCVWQEQARHVQAGGKIEDADWLQIARERGLDVVNCGL